MGERDRFSQVMLWIEVFVVVCFVLFCCNGHGISVDIGSSNEAENKTAKASLDAELRGLPNAYTSKHSN